MKEKSVDKLALWVLGGICILITLSQIPAEFGYSMTDLPFLALGISGVFAVVTGIILFLRNRADKSDMVTIILTAFLFLWSMISYYTAYNPHTALWGQDGRYDGLVTTILYLFLFLTACMISSDRIEMLMDIIVCAGVFHSLWAVYQILPFGTSYYKNLDIIAVDDIYLTSGLTGSPFFYSMLMTAMFGISIMGAVFTENKKRSVLYTIAMVLFLVTLFKTHTLSAVIGIIAVYIISAVVCICSKKIKTSVFILGMVLFIIGMINLFTNYKFYDGGIVWQDSFFRLGVTGYYSFSASDFDVHNLKEVYSYLWNEAISAIKQFPFVGTGIDCFSYTQYKTTSILQYELNSIDRPYNDYLFLGATRGIPYLIGYITLVIYCLIRSIKTARNSNKWCFKVLPVVVFSFILVSIFNNSSVTVMPFMWIILGLCVNKDKEYS